MKKFLCVIKNKLIDIRVKFSKSYIGVFLDY